MDFQDGGRDGHLGFSIDPVSTIMSLLGAPMLLIKFQFNWIIVFRGEAKIMNSQHFFRYKYVGPIQMHGGSKCNLAMKRSNVNVGPSF